MTEYIPNYVDPFDDTPSYRLNLSQLIEILCINIPLVDTSLEWSVSKFDSVDVENFKPGDSVTLISNPKNQELFGLVQKKVLITYTKVSRRSIFIRLIDTKELYETESAVYLNIYSLNQEDIMTATVENLIQKNESEKDTIFKIVKTR